VGAEVHLAEPAETWALRGPKGRAKTDRADAKHLRELLQQGRVPESWIPPEHILELRSLVRLRRALVEERTSWQQHPRPAVPSRPPRPSRPVRPRAARLGRGARAPRCGAHPDRCRAVGDRPRQRATWAGRPRAAPSCEQLAGRGGLPGPLRDRPADRGRISRRARRRPPVLELAQGVRFAGLDITVSQSDSKCAPGKLSRQGPATLQMGL
jgi:transposase